MLQCVDLLDDDLRCGGIQGDEHDHGGLHDDGDKQDHNGLQGDENELLCGACHGGELDYSGLRDDGDGRFCGNLCSDEKCDEGRHERWDYGYLYDD